MIVLLYGVGVGVGVKLSYPTMHVMNIDINMIFNHHYYI